MVRGAIVHRLPGVAAAVFRSGPERAVYDNALLQRGLAAGDRAKALDAMESVYAAAGVARFAAWVHESDEAMRRDLERRGYTLDTSRARWEWALRCAVVGPRDRARTTGLGRAPSHPRRATGIPRRRRRARLPRPGRPLGT